MTPITDKPHLFELWWERYMPNARQTEAWEAWMAAPRADGVGVASQQAEPKTCIYPSCQHNGCRPDCEEQAEPSSGSSKQAPGLCSGSSEPSEARVEAAAKVLHDELGVASAPWEELHAAQADAAREIARAVLQAADAVSAGAGWQPIETAPKDGKPLMLGSVDGSWVGKWSPVYPSGYAPENPWFSLMLNHDHIGGRRGKPTHWMRLPAAPGSEKEAGNG